MSLTNNCIVRFQCNFCEKKFSYRQGKSRHQKTCKFRFEKNNKKTDTIIKIDDTKIDDTKIDDTKIDDTKIDDTKIDDTKIDDTKIDDTKIDDTKIDDTKNFEKKTELTTNLSNISKNSLGPVVFGCENNDFITHEYLDNLLTAPYTLVKTLVRDLYFVYNRTVSIYNKSIRILKKTKTKPPKFIWEITNTDECISDMIDRAYLILDIYFTQEGGSEKLSEEQQKTYLDFQTFFDEQNIPLRNKLVNDVLILFETYRDIHKSHQSLMWKE